MWPWLVLLTATARPTGESGPLGLHYEADAQVASRDAGPHVRVWYARTGRHAASEAFVSEVARRADDVVARMLAAGWPLPIDDTTLALDDDGGDGRFDVYLLDFGKSADGTFVAEACPGEQQCGGYLAMENDFAGYGYASMEEAIAVLVSHELMHAVGAGLAAHEPAWWDEGVAVWAQYAYGGSVADAARLMSIWGKTPERALLDLPQGPFDAWSYAGSTFVAYLALARGAHVLQAVYAQPAVSPDEALHAALAPETPDAVWSAFVAHLARADFPDHSELWSALSPPAFMTLAEAREVIVLEPLSATYRKGSGALLVKQSCANGRDPQVHEGGAAIAIASAFDARTCIALKSIDAPPVASARAEDPAPAEPAASRQSCAATSEGLALVPLALLSCAQRRRARFALSR